MFTGVLLPTSLARLPRLVTLALFGVFAVALALVGQAVVTAGPTAAVLSVPQGTWDSNIKVQNLSATAGTVTVTLYDNSGNPTSLPATPIAANGSVEFFLPRYDGVTATPNVPSGRYSGTVSATVPIATIATGSDNSDRMADSYNGEGTPSASVGVPYIYKNAAGANCGTASASGSCWNTTIFAQNLTGSTTSITLTSGATTCTRTSVPNNATAVLDLENFCATFGNNFIGAGTVTALNGGNLAVAAFQISEPRQYSAMTPGATTSNSGTTVVLPTLYNFATGRNWRSGVNVLGTVGTNVEVRLYPDSDQPAAPAPGYYPLNGVIASGGSVEFFLPSFAIVPCNFKGSAQVISSGAAISAAAINQSPIASANLTTCGVSNFPSGSPGSAHAFLGQTAATATNQLSFPSLYQSFGPDPATNQFLSYVKIVNLDAVSRAVTFTFSADSDSPAAGSGSCVVTLAANGSVEYALPAPGVSPGGAGVGCPTLPVSWRGSARVVGPPGSKIVGTALNTNYGRGYTSIYVGANY